MASWVEFENESGFSIHNLPYGSFSTDTLCRRVGVAIGNHIIDMRALSEEGLLEDVPFDSTTLRGHDLNAFAALGKDVQRKVRAKLQALLYDNTVLGPELRDNQSRRSRLLVPMSKATLHLPMNIGDYTDFFVGLYHAQNVRGFPEIGKSKKALTTRVAVLRDY